MSTLKNLYRATNQAITITLASLANNGQRSALAIDNTTNLDLDALVVVKIKSGAAAVSATGFVNIYAYGSADAGSTYPEGCGTDVGVTLTSPTNLKLIGVLNVVANATTYQSEPMSIATAFNGILPDHWGICIENKTGAALDSTEGNHAKFFAALQASLV
jgi:hypothetical protein